MATPTQGGARKEEGTLRDADGNPTGTISIGQETAGSGSGHLLHKATDRSDSKHAALSTSGRPILLQPPSKEIKDLGTKARARLEEERMKRPEIRVLDSIPTIDPKKQTTRTTSFLPKPPRKAMLTSGNRKRKAEASAVSKRANKSFTSTPRNRTLSMATIPARIADIGHISIPSKEEQSLVVKLHGLPLNCTLNHIQKFFTGIALQRVSMLLPNDTKIACLDASNSRLRQPKNNELLTCEDRYLRVLVHFSSGPVAALAAERTGETIRFPGSEDSNSGTTTQEFVIGVTVLPKQLAKQLARLVRIKHRPNEGAGLARGCTVLLVPGVSCKDAFDNTTINRLHSMIGPILWSITSRQFDHELLPLAVDIRNANLLPTRHEQNIWNSLFDDQTKGKVDFLKAYQCLTEHFNRLVDIQDDLLHQLPYPAVEMIAANAGLAAHDPFLSLTTQACHALSNELYRIQRLLYRARVTDQISRGG